MFKKIYFKIELIKAYIRKNFIFLTLGLIIGSLISYFGPNIVKFINSNRIRTEVIGINGFYTVNKLPDEISSLISFGLTTSQENGKIITSPILKNWQIDNTNTVYTFNLNDYYWHDGRKLTSKDINYNFAGSKIVPISNISFRIITEKPFAPLLSLLKKPLLDKDLIGLGPYKVTNVTYQDSYIKTLFLKPRQPNIPAKDLRFFGSEKEIISAYKMGKIDIINQIDDTADLDSWPKTEIIPSLNYNRYIALFINTSKINDKKNRQALSYATPKTLNNKDRCLGPISPESWAFNNDIKEYAQNSSRAKELFNHDSLSKINISLNDRRLLPLAENIKSAWKSILGLDVTISIENEIDTQNYDVILAYGSIPSDPDQYVFWHSTQKTNLTKINNSRIDKLLEEGRLTFDNQERKRIYLDFQKYLLEESPAIFLNYPTYYSVTRVK